MIFRIFLPKNKWKDESGTSFVYVLKFFVVDFSFSDLFSEVHVEKSYFKNRIVKEKIQMFSVFL